MCSDTSLDLSQWISLIRDVVLVSVSIFTGWWAYRTFAHKEKILEIKAVITAIDKLHADLFYVKKPTDKTEAQEYIEKVSITLSELSQATASCLYMKAYLRIELKDRVATLLKTGISLAYSTSESESIQIKDDFIQHSHSLQKFLYDISKKYT